MVGALLQDVRPVAIAKLPDEGMAATALLLDINQIAGALLPHMHDACCRWQQIRLNGNGRDKNAIPCTRSVLGWRKIAGARGRRKHQRQHGETCYAGAANGGFAKHAASMSNKRVGNQYMVSRKAQTPLQARSLATPQYTGNTTLLNNLKAENKPG
ncbi:MAG: hypothetical protein ACOY9J_09225 [Pseudomonadota bacterium]